MKSIKAINFLRPDSLAMKPKKDKEVLYQTNQEPLLSPALPSVCLLLEVPPPGVYKDGAWQSLLWSSLGRLNHSTPLRDLYRYYIHLLKGRAFNGWKAWQMYWLQFYSCNRKEMKKNRTRYSHQIDEIHLSWALWIESNQFPSFCSDFRELGITSLQRANNKKIF